MTPSQVAGRVEMVPGLRAAARSTASSALSIVAPVGSTAETLCLLVVALLVGADVVAHVLVLLEQEPEHAVQLLGRLDLHLGVGAHRAQLLLQVDDTLYVVLLERGLVGHDVVVGAGKVLLQLVVEGLSRDLHTDAEHDMDVDDLLL